MNDGSVMAMAAMNFTRASCQRSRPNLMADLEFFWDPVCPWAWITSRWVVNVLHERPMDVEWRFISLRMVNHDKDYEKDFRPGYERGHLRGLELLRVAAAVREELGRDAVLPLYSVF